MPIYLKDNNVFSPELLQGSAFVKVSGNWVEAEQIFVEKDSVWLPMFPVTFPRWGIGQFADTDFTGGKSGTNQAGGAYETWSGPQDFIDSVCTNIIPSVEDEVEFSISVSGMENYGYYAHPAEWGNAIFTDTNSSFSGAWDGASWEDGGFTGDSGPLVVSYDDGTGAKNWHVYRTDFSAIGSFTYSVSYPNN